VAERYIRESERAWDKRPPSVATFVEENFDDTVREKIHLSKKQNRRFQPLGQAKEKLSKQGGTPEVKMQSNRFCC